MKASARALLAGAFASVVAQAPSARAWTFPEHTELTRLALEDHAPGGVARVLGEAAHAAQRAGLPLCSELAPTLASLPLSDDRLAALTAPHPSCIPYTTLAGIAGDHAVDARGLWLAMTTRLGRTKPGSDPTLAAAVVGSAVIEWRAFLENVSSETARVWTSAPRGYSPTTLDPLRLVTGDDPVHPRDFVRKLDARMMIVDHDYATRAGGSKSHFQDSTASVEQILHRFVHRGDTDNALAQTLAHHAVSLRLAVRARAERGSKADQLQAWALLEHAMALHFLQDAFAAGHIATDPGIESQQDRLRRHDHFNRVGLVVTRALGVVRCGRNDSHRSDGRELPPCWMAYGDGYATYQDRLHASEATARLQLQFALALDAGLGGEGSGGLADPSACPAWCDPKLTANEDRGIQPGPGAGEPCTSAATHRPDQAPTEEGCDLWRAALLLDPFPTWTFTNDQLRFHALTRRYALKLLHGVSKALVSLATAPIRAVGPPADNRATAALGHVGPAALGDPLHPCRPLLASAKPDFEVNHPCFTEALSYDAALGIAGGSADIKATLDRLQGIDLARPDVSLWRPILVAWPVAQTEVTTLRGADAFGQGWTFQLLGFMNATARPDVDVKGFPAIGVGMGIAYRWDAILPHRDDRALLELNAAIEQAIMLPDRRFLTLASVELRVPVITAAILAQAFATRSSGMLDAVTQRFAIGLFGARGYVLLEDDRLDFVGGDVEVAYFVPARPDYSRGAARQGTTDAELRLRVGALDFAALAKPTENKPSQYGFIMGLEFAGGYGWFL